MRKGWRILAVGHSLMLAGHLFTRARLQSSAPSVAALKEGSVRCRCLCPAQAPCTLDSRIDPAVSLSAHDLAQGINTTTAATLHSFNPSVQALKVMEVNQSCVLQNKIGAAAKEPVSVP